MNRRDIRNRYPFHSQPPPIARGRAAPYNRHSLRHRWLAFLARVRRVLGL